jgi:hypothetical protein
MWSLSVAISKFITEHIRVKSNVTNGGNQRLHGIGIGKITSPMNGKRSFIRMPMVKST